jgi:hypothetical protein
MADLYVELDDQLRNAAHEALGEVYQMGEVWSADVPTFEGILHDKLVEKGGLDEAQVGAVVAALANDINLNHQANPIDFVTHVLFPKTLHELSGLYYDEAGNWYQPDGTPSPYAWSAEHELFYDDSGGWYNTDLSPYESPETASEVIGTELQEPPVKDPDEFLTELLNEVFAQVPEAADLPADELAELLQEALAEEAR